uniref:NADH dehydrogenase (Ubiquinone) complex I, assembly factor 6 n=1 Tax=Onchocerca volvulus TaxID=6282 RepID=A0A8R1TII1_ONCVO
MNPTSLSIFRGICLAGLISLLHCAYSAAQHRFYLRLTEQPFTQLPLDITVQTIVSLIAFIYSATFIAGEFQPIRSDLQNRTKSWDTVGNCPSFYTFDHRAKTLSPSYIDSLQDYCNSLSISTSFQRKTASFPAAVYKNVGDDLFEKSSIQIEGSSQRSPQLKPPSKKVINEALNQCLQITRKRDYTNYVAGLVMPSEIQPALFTLLAFNVELAVIRDQVVRSSGVSGIYRLQFWKDTLDVLYGQAKGPLPRQPVAIALSVFRHHFDEHLLRNLIVARQRTLGDRPFESLNDIRRYGIETTGSVIQLMMHLLSGYHLAKEVLLSKEAIQAVESMSYAVSIITLIRSVMPLLARGIFLLPSDLMEKYHLSADDVLGNKKQNALRDLVMELTNIAEEELLKSRQYRGSIEPNLRLALMASGTTLDHLVKTLHKSNYNLLNARLQRGYDLLAWRLWWRKLLGQY